MSCHCNSLSGLIPDPSDSPSQKGLESKLMFPAHFWIQTAKGQENSCKNRQKEEEEEEEDDFGASEHHKRELRKQ